VSGPVMFQQPAQVWTAPEPAVSQYAQEYLTAGTWATEIEAAAAFDSFLNQCGLWSVYREVPGTLIQPRPSQADKGMRIDRILLPTPRLLALGWTHGAIGVEIKRSGVKIGPPIAQAMDYGRTVWRLDQLGGLRLWLDWVFIWPMTKRHGPIASVLAQNRIGSASSDAWTPLCLWSGEQNLIRIERDGTVAIGTAPANGRKAGSR
jgi:hypothetical protein